MLLHQIIETPPELRMNLCRRRAALAICPLPCIRVTGDRPGSIGSG